MQLLRARWTDMQSWHTYRIPNRGTLPGISWELSGLLPTIKAEQKNWTLNQDFSKPTQICQMAPRDHQIQLLLQKWFFASFKRRG